MIFITLAKFKKKPTKEFLDESNRIVARGVEDGMKPLGMYWTLGRYDAVLVFEAPNEKIAEKILLRYGDWVSTETLVAVPREEAAKLVE